MNTKRILLTGGGTGGHIFPLIAVADSLIEMTKGLAEIFYVGPVNPFNVEFEKRYIKTYAVLSSKLRRYFDLANFIDVPKLFLSFFQALFLLYKIMPDVVFSKGGPGALPVVLAARFYLIPVIIHDSDAVPGLANRLCAPLAKRIAVSFKKAVEFFPLKKTALTGNPVRKELIAAALDSREAKINLGFDPDKPLVAVLGASQGAVQINNFILSSLETLLKEVQIFHQTGPANEAGVQKATANVSGYKASGFLEAPELRTVLSAADVVISRASAGAIFEIAAFGKPAILIPLPGSASNHQLYNAYEYAESGAAVVVEEPNFKANIILLQIKNILGDAKGRELMSQAAKNFSRPQAAQIIAQEVLKLAHFVA